MANLTFAQYISTTLAYANENRDNPSTNRKFREADVKTAINCGRHRMLRRVGVGLYRNQDTMDATTGDVAGASVQIGDPITEKQMIDVVLQASERDLYRAITDCGAGRSGPWARHGT